MQIPFFTAILALSAPVAVFSQGKINLDAYNSELNPTVMWWQPMGNYPDYSGGYPLPLNTYASFTIGFYWAPGIVNYTDPYATVIGGADIPGAPFTLATGPGATTSTLVDGSFLGPGTDFVFPGVSSGPVTLVVVAYSGADYASSIYRGHSLAFQITPAQFPNSAPLVGDYMPSFFVSHLEGYSAIPEPSVFALGLLGAALLVCKARRIR